ncbi:hypothetical protein [Pseudomonas quasicaspiana]|uniref:hypothetical protein n=1 Tax=Pseudomonas quasicaspiana TaxID=2829821 RepID=UPI001E604568|nr:hypothetical protein [Pseudomonas quasicaspiana]MCD5970550.1 hypothetical protein [Pseudomonas quasicaspiana]
MINTVSSASVAVGKVAQLSNVSSGTVQKKTSITVDTPNTQSTLSMLSRQLAESAVRADARDKTMDRRQLGVETSRILRELVEYSWRSDEVGYITEYPDTKDPELLERAQQATEYEGRFMSGNHQAKNPFAELSRDQLNLIIYDEKGPYTLHERNAAHTAVNQIENKWNRSLWGPERQESAANNGRTPRFYAEILSHYKTLPLIEQVQYPDNYETRLARLVTEQSGPAPAKEKEFRILTLFEVMAKYKYAFGKGNKATTQGVSPLVGVDTPASAQPPAIKTNN